jgi:hypothetical protein
MNAARWHAIFFDWRLLVPRYIDRFSDGHTDWQIYCFGVAHGQTVTELSSGFSTLSMALPHMHLFDSFQGLPQERSGIAIPPIWHVGAYREPSSTLKKKLESIGLHDYTLHDGWFKDTLDPLLVANASFKPAVYVDIDADLYSSTIDILDFMFSHDLIRSGTLIGYDDWGNTDLWTASESRAHKEMTAKYGARCAQLFSWGEPPTIRKLFLVV